MPRGALTFRLGSARAAASDGLSGHQMSQSVLPVYSASSRRLSPIRGANATASGGKRSRELSSSYGGREEDRTKRWPGYVSEKPLNRVRKDETELKERQLKLAALFVFIQQT